MALSGMCSTETIGLTGRHCRTLLDNNVDVNLPIALTDAEISSLKPMEEAHCAGSGALVEAARTGNMRLVKLLLAHGALDYNNRALAMAVKVIALCFSSCRNVDV